MDAPSHSGDNVHFIGVPGAYRPGEDVFASFRIKTGVAAHSRDWVGLFRVGWTSKRDYYTFEWAPNDQEEEKRSVKFLGSRLPHEDGLFYQFCYVSKSGDVHGASRPFQFTKSARNGEDLEMVEVEEDASLVLLRSRSDTQVSELEKKVAELTQKNENVEESFVQVRTECQGVKTERDQMKAELAACSEQLQQANAMIAELQSAHQGKQEEVTKLTEANAANKKQLQELQAINVQMEQALQASTEVSQLKRAIVNMEEKLDEANKQISSLTAANQDLVSRKEASETDLRMQCNTLEENVRTLEEEKEVLLSRNEYYTAESERLDQCLQDQKAQFSSMQRDMSALAEQLDKEKASADELRETLTLKEQELNVAQQNLCEVIGNIKEPRDILPEQPVDDKVEKTVYDALQRAYEDVEARWRNDEKVISQQKLKVTELEERVRRCEQEYVAIAMENSLLKKTQQQVEANPDQQETSQWKEQAEKFEQELKNFQEKHDQRIAEKNERLQEQQDVLDAKLGEIAGLQNQQNAMQTVIDSLTKENGQLKRQIHQLQGRFQQPRMPGAPVRQPGRPAQVDANSRQCPVCGMCFPLRTNQADIERHVNAHFD